MRRCELAGARRDLLDLAAGTLTIETTRVVVDGKVIESDGKTKNAQHALARAIPPPSPCSGLPEIDLHDARHSYATAGRDAKIDWKALSQRIRHADARNAPETAAHQKYGEVLPMESEVSRS